jgi:indole-3-acetate monooxygenase
MVTSHSPPSTSVPTEADVIAGARRLVPQVRAAREECEMLRRVPTPIADALAKAGLLQMYLPRSMGGQELPWAATIKVRFSSKLSRYSHIGCWVAAY